MGNNLTSIKQSPFGRPNDNSPIAVAFNKQLSSA